MRVKNVRLRSCLFSSGRGNEWPGGRWWGRHSRHALRNANLSFTFFFFSLLPPLLYVTAPLFFSEKVWHVCCPHSISHGTLFEKTIHACCQRVFVRWMESPPSTSSPTYQFGLNPLEMSKSHREQKGLTHRDPLCSKGGAQAEVWCQTWQFVTPSKG